MSKHEVIFILGGPGSGKGTQCTILENKYDIKHISVGDLLRAEKLKKPPSKYGSLINKYLSQGMILPVQITLKVILSEMEKYPKSKLFLIDGFPRNKDNIDGWNEVMKDKCNVNLIIYYECCRNTMISRIKKRSLEVKREDDSSEIINKRLDIYYNDSVPIIEYYKSKNMVITINSDNQPIDCINKMTEEKILPFLDSRLK